MSVCLCACACVCLCVCRAPSFRVRAWGAVEKSHLPPQGVGLSGYIAGTYSATGRKQGAPSKSHHLIAYDVIRSPWPKNCHPLLFVHTRGFWCWQTTTTTYLPPYKHRHTTTNRVVHSTSPAAAAGCRHPHFEAWASFQTRLSRHMSSHTPEQVSPSRTGMCIVSLRARKWANEENHHLTS